MDIDPLQESAPPRYAIESDEEDEFNPGEKSKSDVEEDTKVEIKIVGDIPSQKNLIVASGDSGKFWAKGANLGEQTAAVTANGVQIGLAFKPTWTKSTIIVSESFSRLPLSAMHPYAEHIIQTLKPPTVALLDSYPVPTYSTDKPLSFDEAPLRYLTNSDKIDFLETSSAKPFAPPNLIQSTSASFLSLLSLGSVISTLILLPSPHIPSARPKQIAANNLSSLGQEDIEWSSDLLSIANELLLDSVGELDAAKQVSWHLKGSQDKRLTTRRNTEVGEGGMYI